MKLKSIFIALLLHAFLNFCSASFAQTGYLVMLNDYLITPDCVPYDSIKSTDTLYFTRIDNGDTTRVELKSGTVFMTGAPGLGQIKANGVFDTTSRSYFSQSKGRQIRIELVYFNAVLRKNCIHSITFNIC